MNRQPSAVSWLDHHLDWHHNIGIVLCDIANESCGLLRENDRYESGHIHKYAVGGDQEAIKGHSYSLFPFSYFGLFFPNNDFAIHAL
jgi:hypothetical protein